MLKLNKSPLLLLLPILLLNACTNPPEGSFIGGSMKKTVKTKDGEEIMEFRPYTRGREVIFQKKWRIEMVKS